jgi:fructose-1,6-bisphosphatase/inositol monophosphatase family enzyme
VNRNEFKWRNYIINCDAWKIYHEDGRPVQKGESQALTPFHVRIFVLIVANAGMIVYGKDIDDWKNESPARRSSKIRKAVWVLKHNLGKDLWEKDIETVRRMRKSPESECGYRFRGSHLFLPPVVQAISIRARLSARTDINEEHIIEDGIFAVEATLDATYEGFNPGRQSFDHLLLKANEKHPKHARRLDLVVDNVARKALLARYPTIEIRSEEGSLDKVENSALVALLDPLDGTDLAAHNLGNWGTAMVIYSTTGTPFIWAAFVGMPNNKIYYTRKSSSEALVQEIPGKQEPRPLRVSATSVSLRDARLCFYGQKTERLVEYCKHTAFTRLLEKYGREAVEKKNWDDAPQIRLYNLAGNPMMIKLLLGYVDVIIELIGQECHDVVPGFVIALKAGAALYDLDTQAPITEAQLAGFLIDPRHRFRYILASNEALARELLFELCS